MLVTLLYIHKSRIVPRGTILDIFKHKLFHVEQIYRKLLLLFGIVLALAIITKPDINSLLFKSLNERLIYLNVSRGTILAHPLIGFGNGQFVLKMNKFVPRGTILETWQFQPVHNVFLLIWSELGIVGLMLFVLLLWKLFHTSHNVPRGTSDLASMEHFSIYVRGILLGFIFIMLFDHYLWDIQQGQIMLWLVFALMFDSIHIDK
jgi:O-antigen ligase